VPYKLCEGAECAFPQVHLAILSLALFVLISRRKFQQAKLGNVARRRRCQSAIGVGGRKARLVIQLERYR
jgi:hypothetical protein